MKQVVTINLGGNAYQLDEDGYETLGNYLDNARERLAGNPDIEEIMSDLELAIADKAGRFLGPNKTVVSGAEVDGIIEEMGPVAMSPGEEADDGQAGAGGAVGANGTAGANGANGTAGAGASDAPREPRKLYRLIDPDEKMIAGVCSGLAAYFGIDVSILRIIFLVLAFASAGVVLIAYLLAIFIIPAAETPEQRAAAWGMPFDAQDVLDRARSKFYEFRDDREARHWRRTQEHYRHRQSTSGAHELFRWLLAAIVIVFGVVLALSLLAGFFGIARPALFLDFPGYYGRPQWPGFIVLVVVLGLVLWLLGRPSPDSSRSFLGSVLLGAAQIIAIIGLIWLAYHTFSFVRHVVDGTVMTVHHMF